MAAITPQVNNYSTLIDKEQNNTTDVQGHNFASQQENDSSFMEQDHSFNIETESTTFTEKNTSTNGQTRTDLGIEKKNSSNVQTNNSLTTETNVSTDAQRNNYSILEENVNGKIVKVNRLKHYAFIERTDGVQQRDVFAREACINGDAQVPKFLVSDTCTFDMIKTNRGFEAINIKVQKRSISGINKLKPFPKKKPQTLTTTDATVLFQQTIIQLFHEAINSTK